MSITLNTMLINEIYNKNPRIVRSGTLVGDALKILIEVESNAAIIVGDNDEVVGVISIQDIAEDIVPAEFESNVEMALAMYSKGFFHRICNEVKMKTVDEIMHKDFLRADLNTNILAVMAELLKNHLYIVPVIENGKLLGVVTRTEVKKAIYEGMIGE